eukprot:scaffold1220_cov259-Pinguiococcus_pyrenoidosus.AAC.18
MAYMLPHLDSGWAVDQAILNEDERVVVLRFGHDWDPTCMEMDEVLWQISEQVQNFAVVYLVDISQVPDFNTMYELYDPCTVMFFFRNKHIMVDLGTGNNNKINWALTNHQELIDIIETVYRGARKGRGLVVSPKDYSTKKPWGVLGATRAVLNTVDRRALPAGGRAATALDSSAAVANGRRSRLPWNAKTSPAILWSSWRCGGLPHWRSRPGRFPRWPPHRRWRKGL